MADPSTPPVTLKKKKQKKVQKPDGSWELVEYYEEPTLLGFAGDTVSGVLECLGDLCDGVDFDGDD